ncbi:MAG: transcriptional regulator [candidate division KSB1 bacterium]|nr:transcriptional regulator [candidate division KSB1 bacterium]MDZ7305202.1 transcriptional regulator [candidate division KSB1 bacterium]MDZ7314312.1 transcriptional regulator [candidate division KSB1 bacterium]
MATFSFQQLRRLAYIDLLLREERFPTAEGIADHFGCSPRTIERDMARLRDDFDAPIYFNYERCGYAYHDPTFSLPAIRMTQSELLAIFLAERILAQYANTALHNRLASAFRKIAMYLPDEEITLDFHEIASAISFNPGPVRSEGKEEIFDQLTKAIANRQRIEMDYFSQYRNEMTHRQVDPYHILNYQGDWYVSGYCHLRREVRDFALTRIQRLRVLEQTFFVPAGFDKEQYLKQQFGIEKGTEPQEVTLKFSPTQARWMREKIWHSTEQKLSQPDGALILKMHVPVTGELKRWVMSYGRDVEVLAPEKLREMVRREVEELVERYRS